MISPSATRGSGWPVRAAAAVWLIGVLGWLVWRADGIGGRPLTMLWAADPGDYDPHNTSHPIAQEVFRNVCEPLFYDDQDGALRGLLAEDDVAFGAGGRRVTIRLRSGISFHDGASLDAAAVQHSFERLTRLGVSPLAGDLRDVGMAAGDDGRTVTFQLPEPNYEFARLVLANPYAAIVSPRTGAPAAPGFVACTGAYRFVPELYEAGESITLVRWGEYAWPRRYFENRGPARIPQLHFAFVGDRDVRYERLVEGDGCVLSLSRHHVTDVAGRPGFRLRDATGGVTYLGFNFQRARWQDPRVRQAIAHALDKAALVEGGPFLAADTPLTPDAVGYDPRAAAFGYRHDPGRSRWLLDEAAFDTAAEVVLLVPESSTYADLAEAIRGQLAGVGLERLRVRTLPRADILSRRQDFDLLLFDYAWGDYTALRIFLGPGPRNLLGYPDNDVASLITQALGTADPLRRQDMVLAAQRVVLEKALWQPLVVRRIIFAVDSGCVRGEGQSPAGELLFHDADTG